MDVDEDVIHPPSTQATLADGKLTTRRYLGAKLPGRPSHKAGGAMGICCHHLLHMAANVQGNAGLHAINSVQRCYPVSKQIASCHMHGLYHQQQIQT